MENIEKGMLFIKKNVYRMYGKPCDLKYTFSCLLQPTA